MALERKTIPFPASFDPDRHAKALPGVLAKKGHGEGWRVESIDPSSRIVNVVRERSVTEVTEDDAEPTAKRVKLPGGMKPSDGDKVAARMADQYPGFYLVKFEPFLSQATLAKMTDDEVRARGALSVALGCKPWDIMVRSRADGGYDVKLPPTYVPSKHAEKLAEAAEVIGRFGWYVVADAKKLTARVVPSDPPTFPSAIPLDLRHLGNGDLHRTPFAMKLPKPGETTGEDLAIGWRDQSNALVGGMPGAGKSVTLNAIIAEQVSNGAKLAILDTFDKSVDFEWCKRFVMDGGWGCNSLEAAVTTLSLVYAEGKRRAEVLRDRGFKQWFDMPDSERFSPILIVVDEVTALLVTDRLPPGVDKSIPEVQEIIESNRLRFKLSRMIYKIISEQRFVGMRVILSTQVTNQSTGLPPTMKALIGHRALQGLSPSKTMRAQGFNDESVIPHVPENVKTDPTVSKGVGLAHLESQAPCVYKSFFASTEDIERRLNELQIPTTSRPEPTAAEIALYASPMDDSEPDESEVVFAGDRTPSGKPLDPRFGPVVTYDAQGRPLKGAAAASAGSKKLSARTDTANPPLCPGGCGEPIGVDGECGCP